MIYGYRINQRFPHDASACCQGLLFHNGRTYQSVGDIGKSELREFDLETGHVVRRYSLPADEWAEGITIQDETLIQLTWEHEKAYFYDIESFQQVSSTGYNGPGWGLTTDGELLIQSNGSSILTFRSPNDFGPVRELPVTWNGQPVSDLNDLQFYKGHVLANIWFSTDIAVIDVETGQVNDWIDLSVMTKQQNDSPTPALNGIMHDVDNDRLFVTGKFWWDIFEIELVPDSTADPHQQPSQRIGLA